MPSDPWQAALADQAYAWSHDVMQVRAGGGGEGERGEMGRKGAEEGAQPGAEGGGASLGATASTPRSPALDL